MHRNNAKYEPYGYSNYRSVNENGDSIIVEKTKAGDFVVCNLSSIVLGNVNVNNDKEIEYVVETQIRAMDNVIDLNYYSVPFAEVTNKKYRALD